MTLHSGMQEVETGLYRKLRSGASDTGWELGGQALIHEGWQSQSWTRRMVRLRGSVGHRVQVSRGFLPQGWECRLLGPLQLREVAEGLWWLAAYCESPHLERTLEGPPDLSCGSMASQRGLAHGSTGLPALPTQVTRARGSGWTDMTLVFFH